MAGARSRAGPAPIVKAFADLGFEPAIAWVWGGLAIEFVGGIALILGLFTRFWAAAAAIELAIITMIYWKTGFSWLNRGYEYTLLWGWSASPSRCAAAGRTRSTARLGNRAVEKLKPVQDACKGACEARHPGVT